MIAIERTRSLSADKAAAHRSSATFRPSRRGLKRRPRRLSGLVPVAGVVSDVLLVLAVTALTSITFQHQALAENDATFGLLIALLFVTVNASWRNYSVQAYLQGTGQSRRVALSWGVAFMAAITIGFLTKTSDHFSRWTAATVFVTGHVPLLCARHALSKAVLHLARDGRVAARRIFLVGNEEAVRSFSQQHDFRSLGLDLTGGAVVRVGEDHLATDLALATAAARVLRPEDIFICTSRSDSILVERCVDAFSLLPAAIHIGPDVLFGQFADMHVVRNGSITSVHLIRSPMSPAGAFVKRSFDLVSAIVVLVALAPLLLMVALIVKLDSRGPAFFRQTRTGFNREPFTIFKFRTMCALEDGASVRQATVDDPRITRVGRWLRRTNIDELPQLLNVILGHMSLVGPRPHALAHDQSFEPSVPLYARRQNVRPGITGWAQVHGWRGETNTSDKLEARVAHDLHYVNNWSFTLDLWILARTMLSPVAYRNAR